MTKLKPLQKTLCVNSQRTIKNSQTLNESVLEVDTCQKIDELV